MKRFLFLLLLWPSLGWGVTICRDTLRPNANGDFNNWDDCNTGGCTATASNYLRVNTDATSDTLATDTSCTGGHLESHHVADFTNIDLSSIDTVRVRAKLWGALTTDSARIGMKVGTDTIWGSRFALTTTPTWYEFTSHTDPHENGWEDVGLDSLQICVEGKWAIGGRILNTEEVAIPCYQALLACPFGGGGTQGVNDKFMMTAGKFASNTSTGNQTVDTGVDSVLKAIRFYGVRQTAEGYAQGLSQFIGIAVSSSQQKGIAWCARDNVTSTLTQRYSADSAIIIFDTTGATGLDGAAVLDSFGTGGNAGNFYINWINAPGSAWLIYYEAYYGSALTGVKVGQSTVTANVGSVQGVTGVTFQPNFIFIMGINQTLRGTATNAVVGVGMASSATNQCTISNVMQTGDASGGYAPKFYQSDTLFFSTLTTVTSPAIDNALKFTSFDADGFSFRVRTKAQGSCLIFWLCFGGGQYQVGNFTAPTAGGTPQNQSVSTTFYPAAVSFMNVTTGTLNTITSEPHFDIGAGMDSAGSGVLHEQSVYSDCAANRTPTQTGTRDVSTKSITLGIVGDPPTTDAEADYKTQTTSNFTITWTTIGTTAHKVFYAAFGPGVEPPAPEGGGNISRQRKLR